MPHDEDKQNIDHGISGDNKQSPKPQKLGRRVRCALIARSFLFSFTWISSFLFVGVLTVLLVHQLSNSDKVCKELEEVTVLLEEAKLTCSQEGCELINLSEVKLAGISKELHEKQKTEHAVRDVNDSSSAQEAMELLWKNFTKLFIVNSVLAIILAAFMDIAISAIIKKDKEGGMKDFKFVGRCILTIVGAVVVASLLVGVDLKLLPNFLQTPLYWVLCMGAPCVKAYDYYHLMIDQYPTPEIVGTSK